MEPGATRIPARSRRQAMDWSLVLLSQGIESVIEDTPENGGWGLLVAGRDSERAFKTLRQYHVENRQWPWPKALRWPSVRFDWLCVLWAVLLVFVHWAAGVWPSLQDKGIMVSTLVRNGEWWRVFTAITLHANVGHLAENLSIGIVLFGLTMGRFGSGTGLLAAYLAGVCGNLASLWLSTRPFAGLGASGMVMGALGLLGAQSFHSSARAENPMSRKLAGVGAAILIFVLYGFSPGADALAHSGGFVAGLALGAVLIHLPPRYWQSRGLNIVTGSLLAGMVATTWWLALRDKWSGR